MFSHMVVGADDLGRAKAFHDAAPGARGVAEGATDGRVLYPAYLRDPAGNTSCGFDQVRG